jgi:hypothetical protein
VYAIHLLRLTIRFVTAIKNILSAKKEGQVRILGRVGHLVGVAVALKNTNLFYFSRYRQFRCGHVVMVATQIAVQIKVN